MAKINLNIPFIDTKGKPIADSNQAEYLANLLANSAQPKQAPKFWALSQKFALGKEVELDAADFELVRSCVDSLQIPVWASGQLITNLLDQKDKK